MIETYNSPLERIYNLLSMYQGECAFERLKGMNPEFLDMPATLAKPKIINHVKWLIKTYEPDVVVSSVTLSEDINANGVSFGDYKIQIEIE